MSDQILEPYRYLEHIPGKGLRLQHIDSFNAILNAPTPIVEEIKNLVERLHTTSLLLDDIEDNSVLRRGQPVAHSIFGVPRTINTASYVMLHTLQQSCKNFPESRDILFEELLALHEGQGLDLYWRDTHTCPTFEEYECMVRNKTGGLYRLAVRLLQQHSPTNFDLVPIADKMGLIYQIQDDCLNINSASYEQNKGFAEDITEGKFSFPIIYCLRNSELIKSGQAAQLAGILRQQTTDKELKTHAFRIISGGNGISFGIEEMTRHYNEAKEAIEAVGIPDPQPLLELLDKLAFMVVNSQKQINDDKIRKP